MCTTCKNMRNLRERISAAMENVKSLRSEMAAKTAEDFDCCDSSEVMLCEAIIAAVQWLGCDSQEQTVLCGEMRWRRDQEWMMS